VTPVPASQFQQAGSLPVGDSQEALLRERVQARWQALINRDFDAAYQFGTPAYRAIYTIRQYRLQYGGQIDWQVANAKEIYYDDPNVARVAVEIFYGYVDPDRDNKVSTMSNHVKETWLRKEGQWWIQQN
jgi:hypothetical protein